MEATRRRLTVGQAAGGTGLSPKAIRLYEARGLLPPADRTPSGYRLYSDRDVAVLHFIRQAKALGLRLAEIKEIIDLQRRGAQPCQRVLGILEARIQEIDRILGDLRALQRGLQGARQVAQEARSQGQATVVCPIIESQTQAKASASRRERGVAASPLPTQRDFVRLCRVEGLDEGGMTCRQGATFQLLSDQVSASQVGGLGAASHVPRWRLNRARAASTPDATWAASRFPPGLSRVQKHPRFRHR